MKTARATPYEIDSKVDGETIELRVRFVTEKGHVSPVCDTETSMEHTRLTSHFIENRYKHWGDCTAYSGDSELMVVSFPTLDREIEVNIDSDGHINIYDQTITERKGCEQTIKQEITTDGKVCVLTYVPIDSAKE